MTHEPDGRVPWLMQDFGGDLEVLPPPPPWFRDAACAGEDIEVFFLGKGGSPREAKRVCASCPVLNDCLDYALEIDAEPGNQYGYGIFAGMTARERYRLARTTATLSA